MSARPLPRLVICYRSLRPAIMPKQIESASTQTMSSNSQPLASDRRCTSAIAQADPARRGPNARANMQHTPQKTSGCCSPSADSKLFGPNNLRHRPQQPATQRLPVQHQRGALRRTPAFPSHAVLPQLSRSLSQNRRRLAHFAESSQQSSQQNVPLPFPGRTNSMAHSPFHRLLPAPRLNAPPARFPTGCE